MPAIEVIVNIVGSTDNIPTSLTKTAKWHFLSSITVISKVPGQASDVITFTKQTNYSSVFRVSDIGRCRWARTYLLLIKDSGLLEV